MEDILRRVIEGPEIRAIDKDKREIEFVASDASIDSYDTVLPVEAWDLARYEKNGIVGYQHDVYGDSWSKKADPDDVIGKGRAYVEDGQLRVVVTFEPADLNEKADKIYRKIQFGSINAVSVGFTSKKGHWGDKERGEKKDVYYYDHMELLEVSVVNIPANANAVKRSIEAETEGYAKPVEAPAQEERAEMPIDNTILIAKAKTLLA